MKLPSVKLVDHPIVDVPNYYTLPADRKAIVTLLRATAPKTMIEIGVNDGYTTKLIFNNVPGIIKYKGIDVLPGYIPALAVQRPEIPGAPGCQVKDNPSFELILRARGAFDLTPEELGQCDAFLIDGDHGREAVVSDTMLARACVRKGGIILWHDYWRDFPRGVVDVPDVLEEFAAAGAELYHVVDTCLAFQRV